MSKLKVGVLGATGMVGQRFVTLLANHPWFEVTCLAASARSAGQTYGAAVEGRWKIEASIPASAKDLIVQDVTNDLQAISDQVDLVFCALDMDKAAAQQVELDYAAAGVAVISNNSAHRWTEDVPMLIPEVNPGHVQLIDIQRKKRGWTTGLIAVKPNCSIQSYTIVLEALKAFEPVAVDVTSLQAISGAGKTFDTWPEMADNVIPLIPGEEEKSEKEPLKIWGVVTDDSLQLATSPTIKATCIRVPVSDGHLANVAVKFQKAVTKAEILEALKTFTSPIADLNLPSSPQQLIQYQDEADRPQPRLDRDYQNGMGVTVGRLRQDDPQNWRFMSLAHNTIRGAAGGAILMAELLTAKNYIKQP